MQITCLWPLIMFSPAPCTDYNYISHVCSVFEAFHQVTSLVAKKLIYFFVHFKNMHKHAKQLHLIVEKNNVYSTSFFAKSTKNMMVQSMSSGEVYCAHHRRQNILQYFRQSLFDKFMTMQCTMCVILLWGIFSLLRHKSWIFPTMARVPSVKIDPQTSSVILCLRKKPMKRPNTLIPLIINCNVSENKNSSKIYFFFMCQTPTADCS